MASLRVIFWRRPPIQPAIEAEECLAGVLTLSETHAHACPFTPSPPPGVLALFETHGHACLFIPSPPPVSPSVPPHFLSPPAPSLEHTLPPHPGLVCLFKPTNYPRCPQPHNFARRADAVVAARPPPAEKHSTWRSLGRLPAATPPSDIEDMWPRASPLWEGFSIFPSASLHEGTHHNQGGPLFAPPAA